MTTLHENWFTEGLIDFEYKKYVLLAYLKDVRQSFSGQVLYPFLADLIFHYQNLCRVREKKGVLYKHFPKRISRIDFEKLSLSYQQVVEDKEVMQELESILAFAIPQLKGAIDEGKELYQEALELMELATVGLHAMYKEEGYLILDLDFDRFYQIYYFKMSVFQQAGERYRGLHLKQIEETTKHIGLSYEGVKLSLIRRNRQLPMPATYSLLVRRPMPLTETILPVAKRLLMQQLSQDAA